MPGYLPYTALCVQLCTVPVPYINTRQTLTFLSAPENSQMFIFKLPQQLTLLKKQLFKGNRAFFRLQHLLKPGVFHLTNVHVYGEGNQSNHRLCSDLGVQENCSEEGWRCMIPRTMQRLFMFWMYSARLSSTHSEVKSEFSCESTFLSSS
jgi:hypothetical protein